MRFRPAHLLVLGLAAEAMAVASCSDSETNPTTGVDASSESGEPVGGEDGGSETGSDGSRGDGSGDDAGPCPGMTECGTTCVQTRTDIDNCGACGVSCTATAPSTASCVVGKCIVTLATSSTGATVDLAVSGDQVYWTTVGGTIAKVPVGGGTPVTIVSGQAQPHAIAVDPSSVYWVVDGTANAVWKTSVDGGAPALLTQYVSTPIVDLAVDATHAYYTTTTSGSSYVMSVPLAGAALAKQVGKGGISSAQRLAVDETRVYFSESSSSLYSSPLDGGAASLLTTSPLPPTSGLAVTTTDLVWGTASITMKTPLVGGGATKYADVALYGITFDGNDVFGFTASGAIVKAAPSGGLPRTLAFRNSASPSDIRDIAVDGTSVYWTETNGGIGKVMKLTPK